MNNEFYCVNIYWEPSHFFRSKDVEAYDANASRFCTPNTWNI